jgi:predicted ATPase/DNA-binding SARP family transcriptional activator
MKTGAAVRPLTVRLFGRARIEVGTAGAAFPARPGARTLFIALAFHNHALERDWLASSIWPDNTRAVGRANLRRHVLYVEQWLAELTGCPAPILRRGTQLALDSQIVAWLDSRAFEDAIAGGRFEDASEIYSDDLLLDLDDEWIAGERQRLRTRFDELLLSLVTSARASKQNEAALRYTQRARAADPYNEAWLRTAMRLRYAAGDRAGALREYEVHRELVRDELDVEPMSESVMLADSIRRLEEETVPTALSFESTTFIGRAAEERELTALIVHRRFVTVAGEPGIGKSRLAVRCSRALAPRYRDGLFIVDAVGATNAAELERMLVRAFARDGAGEAISLEEAACAFEALVVIDGCEHIQHACADVAARLIAAAPGIQVVATSRVPLGVAGETIYRIAPLHAADAVTLFLERTRLSRTDMPFGNLDRAIVERICAKLDGLPLAVELAAARARISTLAEVERDVRRFADRPGFDVLYAAYDSSYHLLDATEQAVLRRLAVFINGWTSVIALAACADIASANRIRDAFTALVEHSLIVPPAVSDVGAPYSMLDATRDFATYRARTLGEVDANERALAGAIGRYYSSLGPRLRGEHATGYYTEIERDRENIDGALETLWRGDVNDRGLAVDLSLAVSRYWVDQGFAHDGVRWLRKGLEGDSLTVPKRLELIRVIATLTRDLGDYESSYRDFSELIRLQDASDAGNVEIARSQIMAANAARMTGNFAEALRRMELARGTFIESGETYLAAWSTYAIGTTYLSAGRFAEAAVELELATDRFNEIDAVSDSSSSIGNLSLCHYYEGRFAIALELAAESLARAKTAGHRYYHAHAALNEALILHALGERNRARDLLIEANSIGRTLGAQDVLISCAEAACAILTTSHADDAAVLLGSVDRARERAHADRFPVDRPLYDGICTALNTSLGSERFEALRVRGRVTMLREAVDRLLSLEPTLI